ncbi:hypothetical protein M3Y95_00892800 [Aphelenchoides besseyi]|nr:hypothetical protein M3Y95_00892800 [Aphelenchoides besseyi]
MKRSNSTSGVMKKRRSPLLNFVSPADTFNSVNEKPSRKANVLEPHIFPVLSSDSSESSDESKIANKEKKIPVISTGDQKKAHVDVKRKIATKPPIIRPVRRPEVSLVGNSSSNKNSQNPFYREMTADDHLKIREIADRCKDLRLVLGIAEDVLVPSMNYLCRTKFAVSTLSQFENKQLPIEKMEEVKIPLEYWYRKLEYDLRMGKTLGEFLVKYAGEQKQLTSTKVAATEKRSNYQILTEHQKRVLTSEYAKNPQVDAKRRAELAKQLNLDEKKIYTWFWDRRMYERVRVTKPVKNVEQGK